MALPDGLVIDMSNGSQQFCLFIGGREAAEHARISLVRRASTAPPNRLSLLCVSGAACPSVCNNPTCVVHVTAAGTAR